LDVVFVVQCLRFMLFMFFMFCWRPRRVERARRVVPCELRVALPVQHYWSDAGALRNVEESWRLAAELRGNIFWTPGVGSKVFRHVRGKSGHLHKPGSLDCRGRPGQVVEESIKPAWRPPLDPQSLDELESRNSKSKVRGPDPRSAAMLARKQSSKSSMLLGLGPLPPD